MKSFGQLTKSENGLGAKIRGFRGAGGGRGRVKFGLLRLGLWVESVVWTEKGKETWPYNARKGGEKARKEAGKVGTAGRG